jgi:hypothetical protein
MGPNGKTQPCSSSCMQVPGSRLSYLQLAVDDFQLEK